MNNAMNFLQNILANNNVMQNPMMQNAMQMYQKGDMKGLENLVNNVARQKGISVDDIKKQIGI